MAVLLICRTSWPSAFLQPVLMWGESTSQAKEENTSIGSGSTIASQLDQRLAIATEQYSRDMTAAVFYHIFYNATRTPLIVSEQMSTVSSAFRNGAVSALYYNTVYQQPPKVRKGKGAGNERFRIPKERYRIPNCSFCHDLNTSFSGDEVDTIQSLYDHCMIRDGSDHVIYIHSKGAYHHTDRNEKLRGFLMHGAFSKECLNMSSTCNVCAARFTPLPNQHVPGNMWVARCSYIKGLIPPSKFGMAMKNLQKEATTHAANASWSWGSEVWATRKEWAIGADRYAAEHWIGSHPGLKPCDTYPGAYLYGYDLDPGRRGEGKNTSWTPVLHVGPRYDLQRFCRVHSFRSLAGVRSWRLQEFMFLYKQVPSNSSWFWTYYPLAPYDKVRPKDICMV